MFSQWTVYSRVHGSCLINVSYRLLALNWRVTRRLRHICFLGRRVVRIDFVSSVWGPTECELLWDPVYTETF